MKFGIALLSLALAAACALAAPKPKLESRLAAELSKNGVANILVSFTDGTSRALASMSSRSFANRTQRLTAVTSLLRENAKSSQAAVLTFLASQKHMARVKSFWITNQIYIKNANERLVASLESFPEISEILLEQVVPLEKLEPSFPSQHFSGNLTWGLNKIQVAQVWNQEGGNKGEGVLVGGIDTGVRYTHEALRHNFVGDYGWLDPYDASETPLDQDGHGTHSMGTIAGVNGVGVAPGVRWMACRGCDISSCTDSALISCGEFMQCPTLPDGSSSDCARAPQIVSNSWGGPGGSSWYDPVIESWIAAGLVPIFAIGNGGNTCGNAASPGDHPLAFSVGNTNSDDGLFLTSSLGPAVSGIIKPDISAPGTDVYSSYAGSDTDYYTTSGTSMACPHVSGVAALLLSRNPNLTYEELKFYLTFGNEQAGLVQLGLDCGGVSEDTFPNNAFGNGRISALNSFNKLVADRPNV